MNEVMECRVSGMEMVEQAAKHKYEGSWAIVALAGSVLQIAAAESERNEILRAAFDEYMKKDNRRE